MNANTIGLAEEITAKGIQGIRVPNTLEPPDRELLKELTPEADGVPRVLVIVNGRSLGFPNGRGRDRFVRLAHGEGWLPRARIGLPDGGSVVVYTHPDSIAPGSAYAPGHRCAPAHVRAGAVPCGMSEPVSSTVTSVELTPRSVRSEGIDASCPERAARRAGRELLSAASIGGERPPHPAPRGEPRPLRHPPVQRPVLVLLHRLRPPGAAKSASSRSTRSTAMTRTLGPNLANVNLTGGEPFLRGDLIDIARSYYRNTAIRSIYITSNGGFPDRVEQFARTVAERVPRPQADHLAVDRRVPRGARPHPQGRRAVRQGHGRPTTRLAGDRRRGHGQHRASPCPTRTTPSCRPLRGPHRATGACGPSPRSSSATRACTRCRSTTSEAVLAAYQRLTVDTGARPPFRAARRLRRRRRCRAG